MRRVDLVLAGLGNVGRGFLQIMSSQAALLRERHGLELVIVGAADSGGAAIDRAGLDPARLLAVKTARTSVAGMAGVGRPGLGGAALIAAIEADLLLEATPVDLKRGEPGLSTVRAALARGIGCVLANKGPLALAFGELAGASDWSGRAGPGLRFSACVGGALPTINLGRRDLAGARILRVEAILNGTCQGILRLMETGWTFGAAVAEMQRRGVAETDPSLDVDGWDQAVKLVILANAVLGRPTTLADLSVRGIRDLTLADLEAARGRGERLVLLGSAERPAGGGDWRLVVGPASLPASHRLARMGGDEMGIVYHTDIAGVQHATSEEADAVPTAAAMLRDVVELADRRQ